MRGRRLIFNGKDVIQNAGRKELAVVVIKKTSYAEFLQLLQSTSGLDSIHFKGTN